MFGKQKSKANPTPMIAERTTSGNTGEVKLVPVSSEQSLSVVQSANTSEQRKKPKKISKDDKKYISSLKKQQKDSKYAPNPAVKANAKKKTQLTAQQSIPYQRIWKDGICVCDGNLFSLAIHFWDISYQLTQDDEKDTIFNQWCDFLNYFDHKSSVQFLFIDRTADETSFVENLVIPDRDAKYNDIIHEFNDMLKEQISKSNHGIHRDKYIVFSITAENYKVAKPKLERIKLDVLNNFKRMGVIAEALDGAERLRLFHQIYHLGTKDEFRFEWDWLKQTGLSTKDFVAPTSLYFNNSRSFVLGEKTAAVCYMQILATQMEDRVLSTFLAMENAQVVSIQIQPLDTAAAIKEIKHKLTDVNSMKITEQKKAVRNGYDMDILPSDINVYGTEAQKLLEDLQSHNERAFMFTFIFMTTADNIKKLKIQLDHAKGIAQQFNCQMVTLDFQQEDGLNSVLPLARNKIDIKRQLTTTSTAIFVPFTTQEINQSGKDVLYYGQNAMSGNMILLNRKTQKNPNGLILGTPGSGKSFAAKEEITNCFLATNDDIMICDPEGEYYPLVNAMEGQVIHIAMNSKDYINPMDINSNYSEEENPVVLKSDFILSLCELITGGRYGLTAGEKTVIDRAVRNVYKDYLADPQPENMPILEDLYNMLIEQDDDDSLNVAKGLELYVTGSMNLFNHRTNVNTNNRVVCYDIKDLGTNLKKLGMLIVQDQVWGRVTENRNVGKATRFYIDEFHLLLKEEQTAAYSVEIWKRFRKWGGVPTGITQNVKDLLESKGIETILENSDFIQLLSQAPDDREILAQRLRISSRQEEFIDSAPAGEGLLIYGGIIIPFKNHFPENTKLFKFMSTRPEDILRQKREKEEAEKKQRELAVLLNDSDEYDDYEEISTVEDK